MAKSKATPYIFSLKLGDKVYTGKGNTAADALVALQRPEKITATGFLTVHYGNTAKTFRMMPTRLKRLFYNPTFQRIQAKQFEIGLKPV